MRLAALALRALAAPALAGVLALSPGGDARACGGAESDCLLPGGSYRLVLPETGEGLPVPALVYLHGWGGSSAGVMKNKGMRAALAARGFALIAPQGLARQGQTQRNWGVADGAPFPRDDLAFLASVLADAADRGVDRDRILLTGFSRGGSMVWDVACKRPGMVRGYAPVSGAFWLPMPARCAGAVDLFHVHGWADRVVPIEGRAVAGGARVQGDAFESMAILRRALGCDARMPDRTTEAPGGLLLRHWDSCRAGRIDMLLHPGGHAIPKGWLDRALDWFEARLAEGS